MTRIKAAAIHLSLSAVVALLAVAGAIFVWYPPPLFDIMGGGHLTAMLVAVDVTLGPVITLVIFNPKKPRRELFTDYTVVGLVQLAALVYGLYVLSVARPAYVVFVKDRFSVVRVNDIEPTELDKVTNDEFKSLPWMGPKTVAAVMPEDRDERNRILFSAVGGAGDIETMPQHFVAYREQAMDAARAARPLSELKQAHPDQMAEVQAAVEKSGLVEEALGYLPMVGKRHDIAVLIDKSNGDIKGYVDVDPWEKSH
jgi:hypothetical protein